MSSAPGTGAPPPPTPAPDCLPTPGSGYLRTASCHPQTRAWCIIQAPWQSAKQTGIDEAQPARSDVVTWDTR